VADNTSDDKHVENNFRNVISIFKKIKKCFLNTFDKKSELMLMRRARAYSSSCSQVILVYPSILSQFTLLQTKIAKNH